MQELAVYKFMIKRDNKISYIPHLKRVAIVKWLCSKVAITYRYT